MARARSLLLSALLLLTACACAEPPTPAAEDRLIVFAATSLRDAFTDLGRQFEQAHPGVRVTLQFAGTPELRTQLEHGAAVDVFASADPRHMAVLAAAGRVDDPVLFARNEPVVVVPRASAETIQALSDLPAAGRVVLGAPEVPIGRYALQVLDRADALYGPGFRARVEARVASRELNVRQVLAKVALGEADAGVVYRTDAAAAGQRVRVVAIPPAVNATAEYPIAVVRGAAHPRLARAWIELVLSAEGRETLASAGFQPTFMAPFTAGAPTAEAR